MGNRKPRKVFLDFVGCRLNQAEIEQMARQFAAGGDVITRDVEEADLFVVNTCLVTATAAKKSRHMIRQLGRANPGAKIVVTGCYAELSPDILARQPHVGLVLGNTAKDTLVKVVSGAENRLCCELEREILPPGTLGRTRAFVKVQDGCDHHCTFCVTTLARGPGQSRPMAEIIEEINLLVAGGYQEVVLTGVHLGSYGMDWAGQFRLDVLLRAILTNTDIPRLRLSSLEPWDLSPSFFDLWQDLRLCPHLHLPLQSGSDRILKRMGRRTTCADFAALVRSARERISDLALTTDVMVGFPGETETDFIESLRYVESIDFARLHVFPYSRREGTAAARMAGQVSEEIKAFRKSEMLALSKQMSAAFQCAHIGKTLEVLWESGHDAGLDGFRLSGLTGNYLRVVTTAPEMLSNTITPVEISEVQNGCLIGHPVIA
nr:tRNA (N(6)-L-threonylcarbamoyladenosine(37)-C(2))-methylthiotransferase MtaB [Anaerolineae bacterium]